ncbi:hypothetical protein [Natrarchaeobaculum sulfurireducens]|uniref:Uncharacterized protein n=1 Tax=Natrarchaeobaculum sulfurireducens TaxID=2044521 RepID=A0A346PH26_9EURY|nr:hypothetical protein [Natrarchaeobaculum sulfurireducens]AXR78821.1 hypothetical protein AArc1_2506 [Natrarchaeobaculum sulfurireducens]
MTDGDVSRREYVRLAAVSGGLAAVAGCTEFGESEEPSAVEDPDDEQVDTEIPAARMDTADFASVRQFDGDSYERAHAYRKRRAVETLLRDPEVHALVGDWVGGFEAYEVLTNHLETVSIQGPTALRVQEEGFPDGDEGEFQVTAENRQTVYGLIDRHTDEIVALEITDPQDIGWSVTQRPDQMAIGQAILETDVVREAIGDVTELEWYPSWKGAAGSYTGLGQADLRHGEGGTAVLNVNDGGDVRTISAFIDGSDPEAPVLVDVAVVDHAVEYPLYELVETIVPADESVLDAVPDVPTEQRPYYTANDGHHRMELPDESFERDDWDLEWEHADAQGVTVAASFRGSPVFEAMNAPVTYTGYYLPPREDRNTREWYFPDDDSVFSGDLLFWDVHSSVSGGPGMLGRLDFPARDDVPSGFQLKTHYHSSAIGHESIDFHSGIRFGPYNYDIAYEFYADGTLSPIFRRTGPGLITQFAGKRRANTDEYGTDGSYDEPVLQHYISAQAIDVTPGTEDGAEIDYFDGEDWTTPDEEFYVEGEPGTIVRFANPDGSERIDVPLDDGLEVVVARRDEDEIGPGEQTADRLSEETIPYSFYHPAQYVDGDPIQGERVILWLLMIGPVNQLPYASGLTNFVTTARLTLSGY